jgi:hypothetical protein
MKKSQYLQMAIAGLAIVTASSCSRATSAFSKNSYVAMPQLTDGSGTGNNPENPGQPGNPSNPNPNPSPSMTPPAPLPSMTPPPVPTPTSSPSGKPPYASNPPTSDKTKEKCDKDKKGDDDDRDDDDDKDRDDDSHGKKYPPICDGGLIMEVRSIEIQMKGEKPMDIPVGKKIDLAKSQSDILAALGVELPKEGELLQLRIILQDRNIGLAEGCQSTCPGGVSAPSSDMSGLKFHCGGGIDLKSAQPKIALPMDTALHATGQGKCMLHPEYQLQPK